MTGICQKCLSSPTVFTTPQPIPAQQLRSALLCAHHMAGQRQNAFMDSVEDPFFLREEGFLHFGGRGNPVACADDGDGAIEIVKGELADVRCHRVQKRASFTGIRGQHDAARLLDRFDNWRS